LEESKGLRWLKRKKASPLAIFYLSKKTGIFREINNESTRGGRAVEAASVEKEWGLDGRKMLDGFYGKTQ